MHLLSLWVESLRKVDVLWRSTAKNLTPAESRYYVTDRELMGVYLGCMKWHHYLHGNVCNVHTDYEPLIYIFVQPHLNAC